MLSSYAVLFLTMYVFSVWTASSLTMVRTKIAASFQAGPYHSSTKVETPLHKEEHMQACMVFNGFLGNPCKVKV